nr:MAG TPA: hypothetical protein [Caudoviricetes sp.]
MHYCYLFRLFFLNHLRLVLGYQQVTTHMGFQNNLLNLLDLLFLFYPVNHFLLC